jgi:hypothetical protein
VENKYWIDRDTDAWVATVKFSSSISQEEQQANLSLFDAASRALVPAFTAIDENTRLLEMCQQRTGDPESSIAEQLKFNRAVSAQVRGATPEPFRMEKRGDGNWQFLPVANVPNAIDRPAGVDDYLATLPMHGHTPGPYVLAANGEPNDFFLQRHDGHGLASAYLNGHYWLKEQHANLALWDLAGRTLLPTAGAIFGSDQQLQRSEHSERLNPEQKKAIAEQRQRNAGLLGEFSRPTLRLGHSPHTRPLPPIREPQVSRGPEREL